jgi:hypothetical protein
MSNCSRLLVRPSALDGESLSSWRQRVAWANGYRLFPIADARTRRVDPDIGVSDLDLQWIADLHGTSVATAAQMTLSAYVGVVVARLAQRSQPRWWLRARYGAPTPNYGPMFCASCLAGDAQPYFRLEWRLGFLTVCPVHAEMLQDTCQICGSAPWPSGCGRKTQVHSGFTSLRYCWHCAADLSTLPAERATPLFDALDWLDKREATVGHGIVSTYEALGALRAICQLFLRNRPRSCIERSRSPWAEFAQDLSSEAKRTQAVEHLCVADRHTLVARAIEMIKGWPDAFIDFAAQTGVTRAHFNDAVRLQPIWMSEVVNSKLARQNRSVSGAVLEKAVNDLQQKLSRMPTKAELRKSLSWQGDKGLEKFFPTNS